jgi:hypothetical protein
MTIWVDAHLSPAIATWISSTFGITALALRDIDLRDAADPEIFEAAKAQGVIFMTKDSDFVDLVDRLLPATNYLADMRQYLKCSAARNFEYYFARSPKASTIW